MKLNRLPFLSAVLFFSAVLALHAEGPPAWHSYPWAIGGGAEINQSSKTGWAQGFSITMDRVFWNRRFALGLRAGMDNDYRTVSNFSGALSLRIYPFTLGPGGAFAQFSFGAGSWQEDDRSAITPVMDLSAGFRFFFLKGFYAEAAVRHGFPFQWGFALLGGHSLNF
jgi:hypothetical protein